MKLEKAFAAERRACREAVRLDLRVERGLSARRGEADRIGGGLSEEGKGLGSRSGWCGQSSEGGELSRSRFGGRRTKAVGVEGAELAREKSVSSSSSDGVEWIDSLDTERDGGQVSRSVSSRNESSESAVSRRKSSGDPFPSDDGVLVSRAHSFLNRSTDSFRGSEADDRWPTERDLSGGMAVTASSPASRGGRFAPSFLVDPRIVRGALAGAAGLRGGITMGFEVGIGGLASTPSALDCFRGPFRGEGLLDWVGDLRELGGGAGRRYERGTIIVKTWVVRGRDDAGRQHLFRRGYV